jgi:hypothetical protein
VSILTREHDDAATLAGMLFVAESWITGQDPRSHDEWIEVMRENFLEWQREQIEPPGGEHELRDPDPER